MIRKMFRRKPMTGVAPADHFSKSVEESPVHEIERPPLPQPAMRAPQAPQDQEKKSSSAPAKAQQPIVQSGEHIKATELNTGNKPNWCPGCGDHGIWFALKNALQKINVPHERIVLVYGIGCHGHMCNFLNTYAFEGLHGRPVPVAEGVKMANDKLKVIVVAGDGDTYGEGMNHFLAGIRANHDVTMIVHNNMIYGLTTGQTSPTSQHGFKSKSTPDGVIEVPVNPMAIGISTGGGFISRGFAGNILHLTDLMVKAIEHDGFSVVDVLQNCVTFNHVNTIRWFNERVYDMQKEGHDSSDKMKALEKAFEFGEKTERIPIGVFYQDVRESYQDDLPEIEKVPLVQHPTEGVDLTETFEKYV